ncbi:dimethylamine monooxygenase subunit DmmA family protein (plasmid) [Cupriavidus metallidurans]|uniref:dimethylamine monooxygenase subunit DmmA family protein n=1 Tax=Cupriavidus metallidurans TaxID=119219 RepID=UPI003D730DC8
MHGTARHHIVVWASVPSREDELFAAELNAKAAERHTLLTAAGPGADDQVALAKALEAALRAARAGTHLYLSGAERQVWCLHNLALRLGIQPQEISVYRCESGTRPVYCVHCTTLQETTSKNEMTCCNCGVGLMVRDHFSRRLGAYMGVVADADNPYAKGQA